MINNGFLKRGTRQLKIRDLWSQLLCLLYIAHFQKPIYDDPTSINEWCHK